MVSRCGLLGAPRVVTASAMQQHGGGVETSAELCEERTIRPEPPLNRLCEDRAEVLFVFHVGSITDFIVWGKIPIFREGMFSRPE